MIKRLIIFILAIAAILFFALKDDNVDQRPVLNETTTISTESTEVENDTVEVTEDEGEEVEITGDSTPVEAPTETSAETTKTPSTNTVVVETSTTVEMPAPKADPVTPAKKAEPIEEVASNKEEPKEMPVSGPTTNVKVFLYEWAVDASSLDIPAGTVNFEVVNTGTFSHSFGVKGVQDFGRVNPGETQFFSANIPAGNFALYSSKSVDIERGMEEAFTVQ